MIKELYNPQRIISVCDSNGTHAEATHDTGFQEYPKTVQLWQQMKDRRLFILKTWRKANLRIEYADKWNEDVHYFEPPRPYKSPCKQRNNLTSPTPRLL